MMNSPPLQLYYHPPQPIHRPLPLSPKLAHRRSKSIDVIPSPQNVKNHVKNSKTNGPYSSFSYKQHGNNNNVTMHRPLPPKPPKMAHNRSKSSDVIPLQHNAKNNKKNKKTNAKHDISFGAYSCFSSSSPAYYKQNDHKQNDHKPLPSISPKMIHNRSKSIEVISSQQNAKKNNAKHYKSYGSYSSFSLSPSSSISITSSVNIDVLCELDHDNVYVVHDADRVNMDICFDKYTSKRINHYSFTKKHSLISSKGLISGTYKWCIKILKCEGWRQEVGIVSNPEVDISENEGIINTPQFGARAVYGNEDESIYYASYDENNKKRCYKDLVPKNTKIKRLDTCWSKGDVIKICLDLKKYHISFFLNDKKVKKKISIQPHKTYYPIISFVGDFQYEIY